MNIQKFRLDINFGKWPENQKERLINAIEKGWIWEFTEKDLYLNK